MKRIGRLVFAIVLMLSMMGGCVFAVIHFTRGEKNAKIVASTFVVYDICREVMGGEDDLMLLMDNGVDMHSYTPTASDIASVSRAELLVCIGGESDNKWVGNVVSSANNVNLKVLSLFDVEGLTLLEESGDNIIDSEHHSEEEHLDEAEYDEHIWLSIRNMKVMVDAVREKLSLVYPEMQELFRINAENYISRLDTLDQEFERDIMGRDKTIIVADRFPFRYLMNDYGLNYYAVFSGCSAESEASAGIIAELVEKVNACDVDYLVVLESSDRKVATSCMANKDCKDGLEILVINSCQSVNFASIDKTSYLEIMAENLTNLKKVLM